MSTPIPGRGWFKIFVVTLLCSTGAAVAGYLLYCDVFQISLGGKGKTMAVVENQSALVKRRASSSYLWNRTQAGQNIYLRDSILVGPESSAALRLKEGSLLEIGENSLIRLDDLQELNQNFMRGAFIVRSEKGDQKLTIDKSGKVKKEALSVRLLTPAAQAKVYSLPGKSGNVIFRWKPFRSDVNTLSLQVSTDERFPAMHTQSFALVDPQVTEKTVPLPAGKYFWRLTGAEAPVTEARSVRVAEAQPMKPVWPTTQPVETWKEGGGGVDFRWVPSGAPQTLDQGTHHLEVANDAEFKQVVRSEKVSGMSGRYRLADLPEGEYFWRVRSRFGELAVTAPGQKITVRKVAKLPVPLLQPDADFASLPPAKIVFRWDFDRADAHFSLEIEKRQGEEWNRLTTIKSARRQLVWKKPSPGTYRWRIVARPLAGSEVMGESEWRELTFFEKKPSLAAPENAFPKSGATLAVMQMEKDPDLGWDAVPEAAAYEITLKNAKGVALTEKTTDPAFSLKGFSAGKYEWTVRAIDRAGNLGDPMAWKDFTLHFGPLPAPKSVISEVKE